MSDLVEQAVIGSMLTDIDTISKVYEKLKPDMFSNILLREAYKEIIRAYDIGDNATVLGLSQKLESEGVSREIIVEQLKSCLASIYSSTEIGKYSEILISDYKVKRLNEIIRKILPTSSIVDQQIGELLHELEQLEKNETSKIHTLNSIVEMVSNKYFRETESKCILTGFDKLDDITGGLEGGDVIVIGARPAVGKSAFTSQVALNMAKNHLRIGFYNLEMSDKQIYERLLSSESRIGLTRIRRAKEFLRDEKERFHKANDKLSEVNMFIRSGSVSVSEIRNECRHLGLDCLVIDYIQLLKSDIRYQSRTSEVGAISKAIKALAMELNIPIIALSQLNRVSEMRENKEPTMGELREAGDIEQDASIIILLWNIDTVDKSKKALKVDKNRQGELGRIALNFHGNEMKFEETDEIIRDTENGFRKVKEPTPFD